MENVEDTDFWRAPWLHGEIPIEVCSDVMLQVGEWPSISHFLTNGVWSLPQPENDAMAELFDEMTSVPLGSPDDTDVIVWLGSPSGSFTLASAWNMVRMHRETWPWARLVWHKTIPNSYSFLCWRVLWKKLSTLDRVQSYHPEIDTTCRFCANHAETVAHLFLECDFTRNIWRRCCEALHLAFDTADTTLEMVVARSPQLMGSSRGGVLGRLTLLT